MKKTKKHIIFIGLFAVLGVISVCIFSALSRNPSRVAKDIMPCVVCIQNYGEDGNLVSEGSGFFISNDGFIATNAHVIRGAKKLTVITCDGNTSEASVTGSDEGTDIAVIKADMENCECAVIGDSGKVRTGDFVMAAGSPGGNSFMGSVSFGVVSNGKREIALSEFSYTLSTIQTDTAINPGNSGGPLVNMKGEVIGICSAKLARENFEGMGFAISMEEALPIINELKLHGRIEGRCVLGVSGFYMNPTAAKSFGLCTGFYVNEVKNPGASFLSKGDVITGIDGAEVTSAAVIKDTSLCKKAGDGVIIDFYSHKDSKMHSAKLILISADEL